MRRYGLVGRTLTHSFSKAYFTKKFAASPGLSNCRYENFELPSADDLLVLVRNHPDLQGLNVTVPYKEDVMPYLTEQTEVVQQIGACNCIRIEDGRLVGYNTDVVGFRQALEPQLKPHHADALVLGTGGASKAVAYALRQLGIGYRFVSRTPSKETLGYSQLSEEVIESHPLIVNTTPLGTWPAVDQNPPVPYEHITPNHFLFDLVYNPSVTAFLAGGAARGAQTSNGEAMLIGQAEESWRIWNESGLPQTTDANHRLSL